MADFNVICNDGTRYLYSTDPCQLTDGEGRNVPLDAFGYKYVANVEHKRHLAFDKNLPVVSKVTPRLLKIQLGLGCNFKCTYCSQAGQTSEKTESSDVFEFLQGIPEWITEPPEQIEFWGGEPLLYWKTLETLIPALRKMYPSTSMRMVTNGVLLTHGKGIWLYKHGVDLVISHDGPGQSLRGKDPFENDRWAEMMRDLVRFFGDRLTFSAVLTPKNYRITETCNWFTSRLPGVNISIEDVVTDYGGVTWQPWQLAEMAEEIEKAVASKLAFAFAGMRYTIIHLLDCLSTGKPLSGSAQTCGMHRKDYIAVDLKGNVLTCQNTGASSGHKIGTVQNLSNVVLNTSTSWANRPNCHKCPVVRQCYGTCMHLSGSNFDSSCASAYRYHKAVLKGFLSILIGKPIASIDGWEPSEKKVIALVTKQERGV